MDLLFRNIRTLIALKPSLSSTDLLKSVYKTLFQVPDQLAFHQIIHFLLSIICPRKCKRGYSWPLDRGVRGFERKFVTAVRSIVMELREEYPQYGIPNFTTSFLSNPSGLRFTCLMIKLSVIALDLQRQDSDIMKFSEEDSAANKASVFKMHVKIFKLDERHQRKNLQQTEAYIEKLRMESTKLASYISERLKATSIKIKDQETELSNWLANNLVIPAEVKTLLLDVTNQQVMKEWSDEIKTKRESTEEILEKLKELDRRMGAANKIIETVIALRKTGLCLDGSRLQLKVSVTSLKALVPAIENFQEPLHTNNGTIILSSAMFISYECLRVLIDAMEKKGMLNYIRSFPHSAIKEQSVRLKQLSTTGKSILQTVSHLNMTSQQLISSTIDAETMSDMETEWMGPYRLEDLTPSLPLVLRHNKIPCESNGIVNQIPGSLLKVSSDYETQLNAILGSKPDATPPKDFFDTSPVKHWMSKVTQSKIAEVPIATEKKNIPKASRLPVLCSSTSKYSTSVTARSRLVFSCRKVHNITEDESGALDKNVEPTPPVKSSNALCLSPVLSPLAVELVDTPVPKPVRDLFFYHKDANNTPDILKHTYTCRQSAEVLVTPNSGCSVDVISYNCNEFNESNDVDVSSISELLNGGTFSPTESIIDIASESFSCLTPIPSNCSVIDLSNGHDISGLKSKDCSVLSVASCSRKENILTPTENKKGKKTPTTLERIISRYKKFKESLE